MRDAELAEKAELDTVPSLSASEAATAACKAMAADSIVRSPADFLVSGDPELLVYDPQVLGFDGDPCLVWQLTIEGRQGDLYSEVVFVDAHSGLIALHYSNLHDAKDREIYDANNTYADPGTLVRAEGDPASGIEDADLAYLYFGDTYDFYLTNHDRDSIDAMGMTMSATVRACSIYYSCPLDNAYWLSSAQRMYFGEGYASADDVVAHELTHGVTERESQLVYLGESGAINESFSDVWGEFVDLTNAGGTDTEDVRWLLGEDLPDGAIRSMSDPTLFGDPDRMGSPYWIPPSWTFYDYGGVHFNSGVSNKLCYLLTDGDDFNGYSIDPLAEDPEESIARVADLYYELQTNLLAPASDYNDMYMQLAQATINLGYTFDERVNVRDAARAVEINPDDEEAIAGFRATPAYDLGGDPVVALTWENPQSSRFLDVILVRKEVRIPHHTLRRHHSLPRRRRTVSRHRRRQEHRLLLRHLRRLPLRLPPGALRPRRGRN